MGGKQQTSVTTALFYDVLTRSPVGPVYIAGGRHGLVAVGLATSERDFVRRVARLAGALPVRSPERVRQARRQMAEYLAGRRKAFELKLDLRGVQPFQRAVLEAARRVPRGAVLTYGGVAARLGRPHAARAVGQALARNPLPVVIPCHRIVAAGGHLRGYLGVRVGLKAKLLALEGVTVQGGRRVALRTAGRDR